MNKKVLFAIAILLLPAMLLTACSPSTVRLRDLFSAATTSVAKAQSGGSNAEATATPESANAASADSSKTTTSSSALAATSSQITTTSGDILTVLQDTLGQIYEQVNPSVVNIDVTIQSDTSGFGGFNFPGFPSSPEQYQETGKASGFVWDTDGNIVTNYHVVENATDITVTFFDGTSVPATVVGTDPDSDLAVVHVDADASLLRPIQMADSSQVKVGQLAVAIGNPFGLEGTMTVGFVSALERSLPVSTRTAIGGAYFTIPDIIQTDAPINPGNSGGALLNDKGQLIGVPTAIETSSGQNAGIGYAVPSAIVQNVAPALIKNGSVQHPWMGVTIGTLNSELAKAMDLSETQRGALVYGVTNGSPADKAGLRAGNKQVTINGTDVMVGGDVIVAINDLPVAENDDVITYLAEKTSVGDTVTLTILRDGKEMQVDVTLAARPSDSALQGQSSSGQGQEPGSTGSAWLGIEGKTISTAIAQAMGLDQGLTGVLVVSVVANSPADDAGLQGGYKSMTIDGQDIKIGGDVITAIDNQEVTSLEDLQSYLAGARPGQQVTLTVLRNGTRQGRIDVTLGTRPSTSQ